MGSLHPRRARRREPAAALPGTAPRRPRLHRRRIYDTTITRVTKRLIGAGLVTPTRTWLHNTYTLTDNGRTVVRRLEALVHAMINGGPPGDGSSTPPSLPCDEQHGGTPGRNPDRDLDPARRCHDGVADARELVAELFPEARWSLLTGSIVAGNHTTGSDLDIVVVLPNGDAQSCSA